MRRSSVNWESSINRSMQKNTASPEAHRKVFADRRRDRSGKREAVLCTAVQMFLERGYSRTTLDDIAERLDITKPALYNYFRNKEDILLACYRWGCTLIQQSLDEIAAHGGTGIEKVSAFIRSYTGVITIDFGKSVVLLDDAELSSEGRTEIRGYKRGIDRRLRSLIKEGIADGSIVPCDPRLAAFSIAGALNWVCTWYDKRGPLSAAEIASGLAETLTQGLVNREKVKAPARPAKKARTVRS
jgi:AcrR family transcriptional regulator